MIRSALKYTWFHLFKALLPILVLSIFGMVFCLPSSTRAATTFYSIHIGSYRNLQNALKDISRLQEAGRSAFYRHEMVKGKGKLYRVYVGKHDEREGAELEGRILKALNLASVFWIRAIPEGMENDIPREVHRQKDFTLHVGSFRIEKNAENEVQRLDRDGYRVSYHSVTLANKIWFRVFVGSYSDEKTAGRAGKELKGKGVISYFEPQRTPAFARTEGLGKRITKADRDVRQTDRLSIAQKVPGVRQPEAREIEEGKFLRPQEKAMSRPVMGRGEKKPFDAADDDEFQIDFRGQLSAWSIESRDLGSWWNNSGLRYIPQFSLKKPFGGGSFVDLEVSANGFVAYQSSDQDRDPEVELYRLKLRYAAPQMETRIGLQKLNFGPALLLRPLKWFDQLDPRDPLQLTEGVYGLRFRYDAMNNANIWFWALYGNEDLKGYESFPTSPETVEIGGRLQVPVPRGEVAATFHTRQVDAAILNARKFREYRMALDGRWDVGIGLWVESALQHQDEPNLPYEWQKMLTLGADYTFGIGSGLYVLAEHMTTAVSEEALQWDEDFQVSAFLVSYTLGFFDSLSAIGYYSWDLKKYGQYLGWQRTYDNLIFQVSAFHYPQSSGGALGSNQTALGAGYGGQLMIIYNH